MNEERRLEELNRWSESLNDRELDYLLEEARLEFNRVEQQLSALDARFVAIVGWALIGVGTLLIAGIRSVDLSAAGIAGLVVIVGTALVVVAGSYALLPRRSGAGVDLSWFSDWQRTSEHQMKAYVLAAALYGTTLSRATRTQRILALQIAVLGLLVEFGALVGYLILTAG